MYKFLIQFGGIDFNELKQKIQLDVNTRISTAKLLFWWLYPLLDLILSLGWFIARKSLKLRVLHFFDDGWLSSLKSWLGKQFCSWSLSLSPTDQQFL